MITIERVMLCLILLVVLVDLIVDWRSARPHRRRNLKDVFVDEGIALAERKATAEGKARHPADLKLRNAVDWAEQQCKEHRVKTTRAELAKLVEIRLPRKAP